MKGKPWTIEEEKQLSEFVAAKTSIDVIAAGLNRQPDAILMKCKRLKIKLEVVVVAKPYTSATTTTTSLVVPKELPSVEETLSKLAGAFDAACKPGLDKIEIQRLQVVAMIAKTYKEILADYLDYRGLEAELMEWRSKYEDLSKKSPGIPPK